MTTKYLVSGGNVGVFDVLCRVDGPTDETQAYLAFGEVAKDGEFLSEEELVSRVRGTAIGASEGVVALYRERCREAPSVLDLSDDT